MTPREQLLHLARLLHADLAGRIDEFVVVGGVCPAFYPLLPNVSLNFTKDIDIVIRPTGPAGWLKFQRELEELGFKYSSDPPGQPICCLQKGDVVLDLLTTGDHLGFSNRFYEDVFATRTLAHVEGIQLYVASPTGFVATKLEAYFDRGVKAAPPAKDLEDVLTVVRGLPDLLGQISRGTDALSVGARSLLQRLVETQGDELVSFLQLHVETDDATQQTIPALARQIEATAAGLIV